MKKILNLAGMILALLVLAWIISGQDLPFSSIKMAQAQEAIGQGEKPHKEIVIVVEQSINGETTSDEVRLVFEDAPEIPDSQPDAFGLYLERTGELITLGSGSIEVSTDVKVVNDQVPVRTVHASHDGPEITFRVNDQTRFLRDATRQPELTPRMIAQGKVILPGSVTPGSLEEIGTDTVVRAWGTSQDGILTADLVVYETAR